MSDGWPRRCPRSTPKRSSTWRPSRSSASPWPTRQVLPEQRGGRIVAAGRDAPGGRRRLVFSSTAAVYGEPARQPIEETDAMAPTNPYGETKLAFERACAGTRGPTVSARSACATSTPRERPSARRAPRPGNASDPARPAGWRRAALPEVTVFGDDYPTDDGTCIRDYIHVEDLARAHVLALQALAERACAAPTTSDAEAGAIRCVKSSTRRRASPDGHPGAECAAPCGRPGVLIASSARIERELGWRPSTATWKRSFDPPGIGCRSATKDPWAGRLLSLQRLGERKPQPVDVLFELTLAVLALVLPFLPLFYWAVVVARDMHQAVLRR